MTKMDFCVLRKKYVTKENLIMLGRSENGNKNLAGLEPLNTLDTPTNSHMNSALLLMLDFYMS